MKTTDPTLQPAADAIAPMRFAATSELLGGLTVADVLTAAEIERLLTVVRAAIAAPVLAIHQPCHPAGTPVVSPCNCLACFGERYPCPTLRALGVTG